MFLLRVYALEAACTVHIYEVGIPLILRTTLSCCQTCPACLAKIEMAGLFCYHVVLLGTAGTICSGIDTLLMILGVPGAKVMNAQRTLHIHAVRFTALNCVLDIRAFCFIR